MFSSAPPGARRTASVTASAGSSPLPTCVPAPPLLLPLSSPHARSHALSHCRITQPYSDYNACFERTTVSKENQLSTFPEEAELGVAYYKSAFDGFMRTQTTRDDAVFRGDAPRYKESEAPLSSCPRNCSLNGYCSARGDCMCYYGYGGSFCAEPQADSCFNDCSGRGRCVRGYCSCEPGRFGIDCSVDLAAVKGWRDLTVFPSPADAERMEPYGGPYPPVRPASPPLPTDASRMRAQSLSRLRAGDKPPRLSHWRFLFLRSGRRCGLGRTKGPRFSSTSSRPG